jgi:hypothetical protein
MYNGIPFMIYSRKNTIKNIFIIIYVCLFTFKFNIYKIYNQYLNTIEFKIIKLTVYLETFNLRTKSLVDNITVSLKRVKNLITNN